MRYIIGEMPTGKEHDDPHEDVLLVRWRRRWQRDIAWLVEQRLLIRIGGAGKPTAYVVRLLKGFQFPEPPDEFALDIMKDLVRWRKNAVHRPLKRLVKSVAGSTKKVSQGRKSVAGKYPNNSSRSSTDSVNREDNSNTSTNGVRSRDTNLAAAVDHAKNKSSDKKRYPVTGKQKKGGRYTQKGYIEWYTKMVREHRGIIRPMIAAERIRTGGWKKGEGREAKFDELYEVMETMMKTWPQFRAQKKEEERQRGRVLSLGNYPSAEIAFTGWWNSCLSWHHDHEEEAKQELIELF